MDKKPDLELSLIEKEDYKTRKYEELKEQVLREITPDIDKETKEAEANYESIQSGLNQQTDILEPEPAEADQEKQRFLNI